MRYAVRRVSPLSALLYGLLLGLAGWLGPGVLLGLLARAAVERLLTWLAALNFVLPLPLTDGIAIDLVPLLQLSDAQTRLAAGYTDVPTDVEDRRPGRSDVRSLGHRPQGTGPGQRKVTVALPALDRLRRGEESTDR